MYGAYGSGECGGLGEEAEGTGDRFSKAQNIPRPLEHVKYCFPFHSPSFPMSFGSSCRVYPSLQTDYISVSGKRTISIPAISSSACGSCPIHLMTPVLLITSTSTGEPTFRLLRVRLLWIDRMSIELTWI